MNVPDLKPLTVNPLPPVGVNRSEWEEFQAYKAEQQSVQQTQGPTNGQVLLTTLAVMGGIKLLDNALKNWRI